MGGVWIDEASEMTEEMWVEPITWVPGAGRMPDGVIKASNPRGVSTPYDFWNFTAMLLCSSGLGSSVEVPPTLKRWVLSEEQNRTHRPRVI